MRAGLKTMEEFERDKRAQQAAVAGRQEGARRMYGAGSSTGPSAATTLYGPDARTTGGSIDASISEYIDRRMAGHHDDRERRDISERERKQLRELAQRRGIAPADLAVALRVLHEREHAPAPVGAPQERRGAQAFEALRMEHGSSEAATRVAQRYQDVTADLARSVPTLATRANAVAAGEDIRVVRALAKYGAEPK